MKKLILTVKNVLLLFFIVILGIVAYYTFMVGINDYNVKNVFYKSKSDIDYKVYLYDNKYFDDDFLPSGRTYISSLIDYIDVDFKYKLNFDNLVSGDYTYYINGTILADKASGNGNDAYWSKSYTLKAPEVIKYDKENGFDINTNIKIDYQKYNKLLNSFKNTYGLSIDGKFKVDFVIESNSSTDEIKSKMPVKTVASLIIPLTQKVIDLSIDLDNVDVTNSFSEKYKVNDNLHKTFCIIAGVILVIDLILVILLLKSIRKVYLSQTEYDKQLRKILGTYDGIIVNVDKIPSVSDMKVIQVSSFEELIDAHSEVRRPINFVELEKGKKSKFVLSSENMVWEYTLAFEEEKDKIEKKEKTKTKKKEKR